MCSIDVVPMFVGNVFEIKVLMFDNQLMGFIMCFFLICTFVYGTLPV